MYFGLIFICSQTGETGDYNVSRASSVSEIVTDSAPDAICPNGQNCANGQNCTNGQNCNGGHGNAQNCANGGYGNHHGHGHHGG